MPFTLEYLFIAKFKGIDRTDWEIKIRKAMPTKRMILSRNKNFVISLI
jgi:hypothetical protein